ncbi:poly(ADP-ribose) glycohydrolase-like [Crassostrea virginica]
MLKLFARFSTSKSRDIYRWWLPRNTGGNKLQSFKFEVCLFDMSEPPQKKRKTILDFFCRKEKGNKKGPVDKKDPAPDSVMSNLETKPQPGSSNSGSNNRSSAVLDGGFDKAFHDKTNNAESDGKHFSGSSLNKSRSLDEGTTTKVEIDGRPSSSSWLEDRYSDKGATWRQNSQSSEHSDDEYNAPILSRSDSTDQPECDIPDHKPSQKQNDSLWKGVSLASLNRYPSCMPPLPPLKPHQEHQVLFKVPYAYSPEHPPTPHPYHYTDKWDSVHVRMPCSPQSEFPVNNKIRKRWEVIEGVYKKAILGPVELSDAICKYNTRLKADKNFGILYNFCFDVLSDAERKQFFEVVLPKIIRLALNLPNLITQPIALMKRDRNRSLTLSQQQIACLLANAFLCTFPRRNARGKAAEYHNYPSINFSNLYDGNPTYQPVKSEKLKCIFHYFTRVTTKMPTGVVTFTRQCIEKFPNWKNLETSLTDIHVSAEGTIEDDGDGLLQVDFANRYLGGGVLGMGAVQEEIRFLICPEMIVCRLFTECLEKNESIIMRGCERFSNYSGYANKFKWSNDFVDKTERDHWGRMYTEVVAIDALIIREHRQQFKIGSVLREVNKAYSGFFQPHHNPGTHPSLPAVCTGNWGCGAFGGDKRLKALIQLIAATMAKRDVCYLTFDDTTLRDELYDIHEYLTKANGGMGIGNILLLIERYGSWIQNSKKSAKSLNLFQFIPRVFDGTLENTDSEPDSPAQSESLEMQHLEDAQEAVEVDGKSKLQRSQSEDYKANTP